ncbi:AbrB/MazE/SpoVT family DNA-binding domain-containing protein [Candidatus Woesearchaeota archaeon]|nr:AbrB/MazE/SpoVT family DNA-binding domain-containing protein [Candidatus Woesearchaeota archaeon]
MKCQTCNKQMKYKTNLRFNQYTLRGYKCSCGEEYYHPEDTQRVLMMNKLQKQAIKAKLGRIRSNLILRLPKDVETALNFHEGEKVILKIEKDCLKIKPCV